MSQITIEMYTTLKEIVGKGNISIDAENVKDALDKLESKFGERFREQLYDEDGIKNYYILLLNDDTVDTKRLKQTKLSEGDILYIFPAIAGG